MESRHCQQQRQLIEQVQQHLRRLAELAREEAILLETDNQDAWMQIDKKIEGVLGEKERSMGALRLHRAEHGC